MVDVVCAVMMSDDGTYLVCRRRQDRHLGGLWEFPGGKLEPGESAPEALRREIREELDIDIEVMEALPTVDWSDGAVTIRLHPFFCRILAGEPQALDHDELRWCCAEEFAALDWAPADLPVLEEIGKRQAVRGKR